MKKIINLFVIAMLLLTAGCLTTAPEANTKDMVEAGAIEDGNVRLHYQRMDDNYEGWGLHIWGAGYAGDTVDWAAAVEPTGFDDFGAYWDIPYFGEDELNFIIHNGDEKDPDGDRTFEGVETINEFWALSGDSVLYTSLDDVQ
ncbi:pullulanase-associated domain-containing protein [Thiospirochaeta perfilievii]|nr:pullulanase-associated domain-containing protein [Thiospirochaeta perfilievii]